MVARQRLITGVNGQDGSYLAKLSLQKRYEVHRIIRRASTFNTSTLSPTGGCAARRQGRGLGAPLCRGAGEGRWGAFSESAEESVDREDSIPTRRWAAGSESQPYVGDGGLGPPA